MLVSYPTFTAPTDEVLFNGYIDPDSGRYPASYDRKWHGGVHIKCGSADVVAIADGTVVAYRLPTPKPAAAADILAHPLGYMSTAAKQVWTHDGFVLIKHETETGENRAAVFYSLYMHLSSLDARFTGTPGAVTVPQAGMAIYRRDHIGKAGEIYGRSGLFHFEIFVMPEDAHRDTAFFPLINGGTASDTEFWGDTYFKIPSGHTLKCFGTTQKGAALGDMLRGANPLRNQHVNAAYPHDIYVRVSYDRGARRTSATRVEYLLDGPSYVPLGDEVVEDGYEYNLYSIGSALLPACPSAGFDMARFACGVGAEAGRIPSGMTYYQPIADIGGNLYLCDFMSAKITRQSDADFPAHMGWSMLAEDYVDDGKYSDDTCDAKAVINALNGINESERVTGALERYLTVSPPIMNIRTLNMLERDMYHSRYPERLPQDYHGTENRDLTPDEQKKAVKRLAKEAEKRLKTLREQLTRLICWSPSEWSGKDVDTRYSKVRNTMKNEEGFAAFSAHVKTLAFWESLSLGQPIYYHFHPLSFIRHFRKCPWRSQDELAQAVPREVCYLKPGHSTVGGTRLSYGGVSYNSVLTRTNRIYVAINNTMRRYGLITPYRQAAFLANGIQETEWLRIFEENGAPAKYKGFHGRGFLQLTWADNYKDYFKFRGRSFANFPGQSGQPPFARWNQNALSPGEQQLRDDIGTQAYERFDSAAYFWVKNDRGNYTFSGNQLADQINQTESFTHQFTKAFGTAPNQTQVVVSFFFNQSFDYLARYVNTGRHTTTFQYYGITERMTAFLYARTALCETQYIHSNRNTYQYPEFFITLTHRQFRLQRG